MKIARTRHPGLGAVAVHPSSSARAPVGASLSLYLASSVFGSTRFFIISGLLALGSPWSWVLGEIDISLASTLAVAPVALEAVRRRRTGSHRRLTVVVLCGLPARSRSARGAATLPSLRYGSARWRLRGPRLIVGSEVGYTDFADSYLWAAPPACSTMSCRSPSPLRAARRARRLPLHRTVYGRQCFSIGSTATPPGSRASTSSA